MVKEQERVLRLKAIRKEIGILLDEAFTLTQEKSEDRQWIEGFWDCLAELDTKDALGPKKAE
jgi:ribulose bisphosphate carboxylase small subunit